ncbi:hypothetical protein [Clostridium sp.]|jgi:spore coat polysaccharide biosynthesis predicted glycosyltransferase SpsG|uniref:hypothetical protein n=1 Tax=Clostridium sp. TaxID=1506 RepID=UPI003EE94542
MGHIMRTLVLAKKLSKISACESTLYELATCGIPTLGIIVAENQQGIAEKLSEMGIIENIGWYDKLDKDTFVRELNALCNNYGKRKEMSARAKHAIDGTGLNEIVKNIGIIKGELTNEYISNRRRWFYRSLGG